MQRFLQTFRHHENKINEGQTNAEDPWNSIMQIKLNQFKNANYSNNAIMQMIK